MGQGVMDTAIRDDMPRKGHLTSQVVDELRRAIMAGVYEPGARLRETWLCDRLGVSRTPVREALRTLAAEGLVELLPNRSVVVASMHSDELGHLFQVCGALEGLAGELACQNVTSREVAELADLFARMETAFEQRDRALYIQLNHQIHRRTMEIAANPVLEAQWSALLPRIERPRALANLDGPRWKEAVEEHRAMLGALASRDSLALSRLMSQHFINGVPSILNFLQRESDSEAAQ